MEKLQMRTKDIASENFQKLAALFPNAVTETVDENGDVVRAIDADVLRQEISEQVVEGREERYQFTWPDKKRAVVLANSAINATLRPLKEKSLFFDETQNLYIEGDNLDVLKLLQETYLGKIKIIYIDPPYNTGHDFVYNDSFVTDESDYLNASSQVDEQGNRLVQNTDGNGRFHTDWLNMIYSRLKLAKNLLTEDGVIFISIDDNEQANLTKICDEIFGADNCLGPIIQNKMNAKNDTSDIQKNHEFILAYRRERRLEGTRVISTLVNKKVKSRDLIEEEGEFYYINDSITTRGEGGTLKARPNLGYTVYYNPESKDKIAYADYDIELAKTSNEESEVYKGNEDLIKKGYVPIRPPKVRGRLGCWTWALEKFNEEKKNIIITGKEGNYAVKKRTFVDAESVTWREGKPWYDSVESGNSKSILDYSTNDGTNVLTEVLGTSGVFNNPKNLQMMEYLIGLVDDKDCYILDFFSGSATTAHAVIDLNAKDNGNRKFILVQLPEDIDSDSDAYKMGYQTICDIGQDRIKRVADQLSDKDVDAGYRVFKIDSSNMKDVYYNPAETQQTLIEMFSDNIKPDRTPEDLLFQIMLDLGVMLSSKIEETEIAGKKVFDVADGFLIACFDKDVTDETVTAIAKKKPYYAVFRDSSMASDSVATNFDQIFETYSPETERRVL
ncbi:MAG: site-specific DNA-methyltransferase [Lachnospiraceae bacterium]|nr:site-specific DNA-methyltransferase [Lachnospiraceae bacterium]